MTTTGLPSGVGVVDSAANRSALPTPGATTSDFADLLAPTSVAAPVASLTPQATLDTTESDADSIDEGFADEYSPEGWIALLTIALGGEGRAVPQQAAQALSQTEVEGQASGSLTIHELTTDTKQSDGTTTTSLPRNDLSSAGLRDAELAASASSREVATQVLSARLTASVAPALVAELLPPAVEPNSDWVDALSAAGSTAVGARSHTPHAAIAVTHPVGTPAWQEEIATRVAWLVRGAEQTATLTLNPADLGPVEVRVAVRESEASVVFSALHADTRAALEAALPRLREMFAVQGLLLTEGSVLAGNAGGSSETASEQAKRAQSDLRRAMRGEDDGGIAATTSVGPRSLLDLYA